MLYYIFYAKNPTFRSDPNLTRESFNNETYALVTGIRAENIDQVFTTMQGDITRQGDGWPSTGTIKERIEKLGLHTSMSVGDLIMEADEPHEIYEVMPFGFRRIE